MEISLQCRGIFSCLIISVFLLSHRLERERLSEKLRQKEVLERELNRERAALQEQLIKQAKLNEIIRQKDLFEKELRKEKNELQVCEQHLVACISAAFGQFTLGSSIYYLHPPPPPPPPMEGQIPTPRFLLSAPLKITSEGAKIL